MHKGSMRYVGAAAVIVGGFGVVACNSVLGIGDFDTNGCPAAGALRCKDNTPQMCGTNGQWLRNGPDCSSLGCYDGCDPNTGVCSTSFQLGSIVPDGTACNDGNVCSMNDVCTSGICNENGDHVWAHWDLTSDPPSNRYSWTDDVVLDRWTGRTWLRNIPIEKYNWNDARAYCANLSIPGYPSGWRLPTRIELASIVDYMQVDPAIDQTAFPYTPGSRFWSSSPSAGAPGGAWDVNFNYGAVDYGDVDSPYRVRCVR